MKSLIRMIANLIQGLSKAVLRFPLTVICLILSTALTYYMISLHETPALIIEKLMFVFLLGSFLGVTAQFACERFLRLAKLRWGVYVVAVLLTLGYYFIISPVPAIDYGVGARTAVAVFALFCAFIWLPSSWEQFDFNSVALIHFKSAFTSILYAGVLSAGLASIIGAVDILLFNVDSDTYGYMMATVWILFATTYYLSLLPRFNSEIEADISYAREASNYPRFLEILVSYIAVPLVTGFTLVLLSYFIKIAIVRVWPSGQLGPMILAYSAAGLIIYILASRLENRFAVLYQRIYPKVLVPVVIMQLVSVYIRLNAYGVTESRYYVAMFGIFSIVIGIILSLKPVKKNGLIALIAAAFAIISVLPPVDAFTVSRVSQINRLENMLQAEGILANGEISPKKDVDVTLRQETTSILNYLARRKYLQDVAWLPTDFKTGEDMQEVLGFEPAYRYSGVERESFYANLDMQNPLEIMGYDVLFQTEIYRGLNVGEITTYDFEVEGIPYKLAIKPVTAYDAQVSLRNAAGKELVNTNLYDFAALTIDTDNRFRNDADVEEMTLDVEGNSCKLRIIFQNFSITYGGDVDKSADYNMFILVDVPPRR